jgi:hypothetical protein
METPFGEERRIPSLPEPMPESARVFLAWLLSSLSDEKKKIGPLRGFAYTMSVAIGRDLPQNQEFVDFHINKYLEEIRSW